MTDTPVEEPTVEQAAPEDEESHAEPGYCRWCGAYREDASGDWHCDECDRYQDATICPTCGGLARVSLLPADMQPAAATPKKGKGK